MAGNPRIYEDLPPVNNISRWIISRQKSKQDYRRLRETTVAYCPCLIITVLVSNRLRLKGTPFSDH